MSANSRISGRKRVVAAAAGVVIVTAAVGAYYLWFRPEQVTIPTVDANHLSSAIRSRIEAARSRVEHDSSSAQAWGEYGMELLAHEFTAAACQCFQQAAHLDPRDPSWPYLQAVALLAMPHPDNREAARLLRQALASDDGEPPDIVRIRLARLQIEMGEFEAASRTLRPLLAMDPGHPGACLLMVRVAMANGDEQGAANYLRACRDSPFARRAAAILSVQLYRRLQQPTAATRAAARAAELPEDRPWPDPFVREVNARRVPDRDAGDGSVEGNRLTPRKRLAAARSLRDQGRFREAIEVYRQLLDVENADANLCFEFAQVLAAVQRYLEAMEFARKCLSIEPAYSDAYVLLAHCLERTGKTDQSVEALRKAVMYSPLDPEARTRYAVALNRTGRREEALRLLELSERLGCLSIEGAELLTRLRLPYSLAAQIGATGVPGSPAPLTVATRLWFLRYPGR